jgi:hypothetical protein
MKVGDSMGSRYYLTGAQIGILKTLVSYAQAFKLRPDLATESLEYLDKLLDEIADTQFIGEMPYDSNNYEIVIRKRVKQNEGVVGK